MSAGKHTAGPWTLSRARDGSHDIGIVGADHSPPDSIVLLAECFADIRKARDTLRDGFKRAAHYLRSLGLDLEMARWALFGV